LDLLWRRNEHGSVTELARRAGVGFASAYRELRAMQRLGLTTSERTSGVESFRANAAHPLADALRSLVAPMDATTNDEETDRTRGQLRALGAPLLAGAPETIDGPVEEVLVRGAALAHRDPAVARSLPVCLFRARDRIDAGRLREVARRLSERHAVGFFLELTAGLSGDARLTDWSRALRDHRRRATQDFFFGPSASGLQRRLADERTPEVARRWGFRMNMDLESFRSLFERFVHVA
jgi:hypothetical protein